METITGYIDRIKYRSENNNYTVLLLITDDQEELNCVGTFPGIDQGQTIEVSGEFTDHPTYGFQLKAKEFKVIEATDVISMERYLGSGAIKGVGETLAKRIVKKFKTDTFRIIEEEPEKLAQIKGISLRIAQEIAIQFIEKQKTRDAFIFLQKYGISNNLAVKIYEKYNDSVYNIIQNNPYKLAEDISGVGFKIADEIASKIGISASSEFRVRCAVLYELNLAASDGHIYLPKQILIDRCISLLELEKENIEPEILNLSVDRKIIIKNDNVYSSYYYFLELKTAAMLDDLNIFMPDDEWNAQKPGFDRIIEGILKEQDIELDELQYKAVEESIRYGVSVISGGPGTGKTTTINTIIRFFDEKGLDILLAAPTGRAAKRMQETTGYEAKTIHRLLEVNGGDSSDDSTSYFDRNEDNPLEADVIIIDEMSMVDIGLFNALLRAISIGTRLIMVGDVDQLPSVGPGQVLRDIIDSDAFSTVRLKRVFRQSAESDIVTNAHKINSGKRISLDNKSKDFFFLERDRVEVIYKHMVELIKDKLPKYVDATVREIQVLTPMKAGPLGVEVLNKILQEYLNPNDKDKKEYENKERLFREGDKVMQIKNNYQLPWVVRGFNGIKIDEGLGVFNGDTGIIKTINIPGQMITVLFDENKEVDYPFSSLEEIELAYAITIHKSQGSEYPAVILPLLQGPRMLFNRNLLYTAVTRAKKCVTILGSSDCLFNMIDNERSNIRYSSLKLRIKEVMHIDDE